MSRLSLGVAALQEAGARLYRPCIRSSDFKSHRICPFTWALSRRLALRSFSAAESHFQIGTLFHAAAEDIGTGGTLAFDTQVQSERDAIHRLSSPTGAKERLAHNAQFAQALFEGANAFRRPGTAFENGIWNWVEENTHPTIKPERLLSVVNPQTGVSSVIQIDRVLSIKGGNWLLDYKTTAISPTQRLSTVTIEDQPRHYCYVARQHIPNLAGIIHIAIQKPNIKPSNEDCIHGYIAEGHKRTNPDYHAEAKPLGPNRWAVRTRDAEDGWINSEFEGDDEQLTSLLTEAAGKKPRRIIISDGPDYDRYLDRVREWFTKPSGEDPPVNLSWTRVHDCLDSDGLVEYTTFLRRLEAAVLAPLTPDNFPRTSEGMSSYYRSENPYAGFYVKHPTAWAEHCRIAQITQSPREGDLPL